MSLIFAFFSLLCLSSAALTKESFCENFNLGKKFNDETLSGSIWKTFRTNQRPDDIDAFFGARYSWFYNLTAVETHIYRREMSLDFPAVDWTNVKYSWNFDSPFSPSYRYGNSDEYKFLLELNHGSEGDITAIPAGETYEYLKRTGAKIRTLKYRFREVGKSLTIVSCDSDHKYLLSRDFNDPDPEDVKSVFEI